MQNIHKCSNITKIHSSNLPILAFPQIHSTPSEKTAALAPQASNCISERCCNTQFQRVDYS